MLKFLYEKDSLKLIIEEDTIGFYLIVHDDTQSEKSTKDYLVDTLEEAFQTAHKQFAISKDQWILIQAIDD